MSNDFPVKCGLCGKVLDGSDEMGLFVTSLELIKSTIGNPPPTKNLITYQLQYVHKCDEWQYTEEDV